MADGFFKCHNALFDKAEKELSGGNFKVFWYIYRKTIGWQKRTDSISVSQMAKDVGMSMQGVRNAVQDLWKKRWISVRQGTYKGNVPMRKYSLGGVVKSFEGFWDCVDGDVVRDRSIKGSNDLTGLGKGIDEKAEKRSGIESQLDPELVKSFEGFDDPVDGYNNLSGDAKGSNNLTVSNEQQVKSFDPLLVNSVDPQKTKRQNTYKDKDIDPVAIQEGNGKEKKSRRDLFIIRIADSYGEPEWQPDPERDWENSYIDRILEFDDEDIDAACKIIVSKTKAFKSASRFMGYLEGILKNMKAKGVSDQGLAATGQRRSSLTRKRQDLTASINDTVGREVCNQFLTTHKAMLDFLLKYDQAKVLAVAKRLREITVPHDRELEWIKNTMLKEYNNGN